MFRSVETSAIRDIITKAYATDKPLLEQWHRISGSGLGCCVEFEMGAAAQAPSFKFYKVEEQNRFVGYFGEELSGSVMSTMFIIPEYRPRKLEFWQEIASRMQPTWRAATNVKNVPIHKFYSRMGQEIHRADTPEGVVVVFEFNRGI